LSGQFRRKSIHAISALGCGIDLDDFGTGHASVATLKSFAVKRIKIDRSFVSHVDDDENQQQMVAMILVIANGLAIETLAEGVETAHEIQHLAANGCGHAQGFAIARPLAPTDTIAWLRQREAPSASVANASFLH
jgi:EAL domain-containing protein (putative c-di-GMP-specific phosphodiesterase class I)